MVKTNKAKASGRQQHKPMEDPRFKKIYSDPRFRVLAQKERKLQVDSRFKSMFTDAEFQVPVPLKVNERGIQVTSVENPLAHLYDTTEIQCIDAEGNFKWEVPSSSDSEGDIAMPEALDLYENANGEKVKTAEEETRRLAVMNCDWNIIKAVDLLGIFKSVHPGVLRVCIYPSEFGKQKMDKEDEKGPQLQCNDNNEVDEEALRKYELELLKYYFAVAEFESVAAAVKVYEECDGLEIERSSNVLDLRFVPDGMEMPYAATDAAAEVPKNYKMLGFYSRALQHSRVELSWDETPRDRVQALRNAFASEEIDDEYVSRFVATPSPHNEDREEEEEEEEAEKPQGRVKKISQFNQMNGKNIDIEIKFHSAFDEIGKNIQDMDEDKSVWDKHLEKKSKKKKESREERKKNMKEKSKRTIDRKSIENLQLLVDSKGDVPEFKARADDGRFNQLYTDPSYSIDPTSKHFKIDNDGNKLLLNYQIQKRKIN